MQGLVAQGPFSSTSTSCGFPHPCSAGGSPAEPRDHPNPPFPPQAVCRPRYLAVGRLCLGDAPVQLAACGQVPGQALVGAGQPLAQRPEPRLQPPALRLLLPDPLAQLVPPCPQLRQPCPARPGPSAPGLARHSPAPFTRPAPLTLQQRRVVALQRSARLAHGGSRPGPANGPAALRLFLRRGPHGATGGRGALGGLAPAQHRPGAARSPGAGERGAAGGGPGARGAAGGGSRSRPRFGAGGEPGELWCLRGSRVRSRSLRSRGRFCVRPLALTRCRGPNALRGGGTVAEQIAASSPGAAALCRVAPCRRQFWGFVAGPGVLGGTAPACACCSGHRGDCVWELGL